MKNLSLNKTAMTDKDLLTSIDSLATHAGDKASRELHELWIDVLLCSLKKERQHEVEAVMGDVIDAEWDSFDEAVTKEVA